MSNRNRVVLPRSGLSGRKDRIPARIYDYVRPKSKREIKSERDRLIEGVKAFGYDLGRQAFIHVNSSTPIFHHTGVFHSKNFPIERVIKQMINENLDVFRERIETYLSGFQDHSNLEKIRSLVHSSFVKGLSRAHADHQVVMKLLRERHLGRAKRGLN